MTNEQNIALVQAYRDALAAGEQGKARRISGQIVEANRGFILTKSLKWSRAKTDEDKEDAFQAACMAVLRVIRPKVKEDDKVWDPERGAFTTYLDHQIRNYVQTRMGKNTAVVQPRSGNMPVAVMKAASKFRLLHGRDPSAEDLGVTQEQFDRWRSATFFVQIDDPGEDEERPRFQLTYDRDDTDYQEKCTRVEEAWQAALEELSPRNREIAERVFLQGEEVKAVGQAFGLCHSSVVQICKRIEVRLKRALDPTYRPPTDYSHRVTAARVASIRRARREALAAVPA